MPSFILINAVMLNVVAPCQVLYRVGYHCGPVQDILCLEAFHSANVERVLRQVLFLFFVDEGRSKLLVQIYILSPLSFFLKLKAVLGHIS